MNLWSIYGNFGDFWGGGGCLGGHPLRPVGAHVGSETIWGRFLTDFGLLLGRPGEHFGGHLGARVSNLEGLCRFFGVFFGASQKGQKKVPKVVQKGAFLEAVDMAQV